jgi:hypothetical protein
VWTCLTDVKQWTPFDSRTTQALEDAYQSQKSVHFNRLVNGVRVAYKADIARMVQMRLDKFPTERQIRRQLQRWSLRTPSPPGADAMQWSTPLSTVSGVDGRSLSVSGAGSLRTRETVELNIALGHAARMSGGHMRPLPVHVDVCEASAEVRARFDAARARLGGEEEWVFHGPTSEATISQIFVGGFKMGGVDGIAVRHGASCGNGVYTDTLLAEALKYGAGGGKKIILARALPGRSGARDSWSAGAGRSWRIFRSGEQLLPVYVLRYR